MGAVLLFVVALLVLSTALANPVTPTEFSIESSGTRTQDTGGLAVNAEAGNVSELYINHSKVTDGWQGYYGNVTGQIVLDDALNNSMYTWELANPEGEIYATRDSDGVSWTAGNIVCATISHIETEETTLNFNLGTGQDVDGINETFSLTTHPQINVSGNGFAADQCNHSVATYVDDTADSTRAFNETLLYSTSDSAIIYTALIYPGGSDGFKSGNTNYDFQMLVPEDGHDGDVSVTDYYFYVELN